jgi:outer membrane protein OmpA-like peptidoglycan-associated protein
MNMEITMNINSDNSELKDTGQEGLNEEMPLDTGEIEEEACHQCDEEWLEEEDDENREDAEMEDIVEDIEYKDDDALDEEVYPEVENFGMRLVELADEVISSGEFSKTPGSLLSNLLSKAGGIRGTKIFADESKHLVSPAVIFDALANEGHPGLKNYFQQYFEVVAVPGVPLADSIQPGDILLRRAPGEGQLAFQSMLVSGELIENRASINRDFTFESSAPGHYAQVLEAWPSRRSSSDIFARRITDEYGRMPLNQMVLRVHAPSLPIEEKYQDKDYRGTVKNKSMKPADYSYKKGDTQECLQAEILPQYETRAECPTFPKIFTLERWGRRWRELRGRRRFRLFKRLRKKNLKLARLAYGRVMIPSERITWMLNDFADNLTITLDDLPNEIPYVNVTIELMRQLWPVSKDEVDLSIQQHVAYRHSTALAGCPLWRGKWADLDATRYGKEFIEQKLNIKLDKMFNVTGVDSLPLKEKGLNVLVTYVSFPGKITRFIQYKSQVTGSQPRSFPEIPKDLGATRLASLEVQLPTKNVLWLLKYARRKEIPSWVQRLMFKPRDLPHFVPRVDVRIDLFRFNIKDAINLDFQFYPSSYLNDYIIKRIQQPGRPWVTRVLGTNYQSYMEKELQISLKQLVTHAGSGAGKIFFVVTVIFPVNKSLLKSIVPKDKIQLVYFPFGKAVPTSKHERQIEIIARHVVVSWLKNVSWRKFKPVISISIEGFTDSVGPERYNKTLSEKRAKAVEARLKIAIDRIWQSTGRGYGKKALTSRIWFNTFGIGKVQAVKDIGNNVRFGGWRGVEVRLEYEPPGEQKLPELLQEWLDLIEDSTLVDKVFHDPDFIETVKCALKKMKDIKNVDDRFVHPGAVMYQTPGGELLNLHLASMRTVLLRQFFGKEAQLSGKEKLRILRSTFLLIKKGNDALKKQDKGVATSSTIKTLLKFTKYHLGNDNSIYKCFKAQ